MVVKLPETTEKVVENLLRLANTKIPEDIGWALEAAAEWETNKTAYSQIGAILDNIRGARIPGYRYSTSAGSSTPPSPWT